MNSFREFIKDLRPVFPYVVHWFIKLFTEIGRVIAEPFMATNHSIPKVSFLTVARSLSLLLLRYPAQLFLTIASLCLNALASLINNVFSNAHERSLTQREIHYLQKIFANNLDYHAIRIQLGGVKEFLKISPQTVGNDIFMRQYFWSADIVNADNSVTSTGLRLLGHEACHAWQFQHGGAAYIGDSLITQVLDVIGRKLGIHLSDGYNLHPALKAHRDCKDCNVEQQAVMAESIGVACSFDKSAKLNADAFNRASGLRLNETEFSLVRDAHQWLGGSKPGQ